MTILCRDISNIATDTAKTVDYGCIIRDFNKSEAINLLDSYGLEDCGYIYIYIYILYIYIYKMHIQETILKFECTTMILTI